MKRFLSLCLLAGVVLTGCQRISPPVEELAPQTPAAVALEQIPQWTQGCELEAALFSQLNLDGVGESDDEVYISTLQFGDYEDKCTVLRVHLGTGETMARILPVYGHYTMQTAPLFSEEKEAVLLEVQVPASNYGAAYLFAFDIFPAGSDPVPGIVDRLNTAQSSMVLSPDQELVSLEGMTDGTAPVQVEGSSLEGLAVYSIGPNGEYREVQYTLLWTGGNSGPDDGWSLL